MYEFPVPIDDPPLAAVYHVTEPPVAVPVKVTVPGPQFPFPEPGVNVAGILDTTEEYPCPLPLETFHTA